MRYKSHEVAPALAERQGWRCALCGDQLSADDLTLDHIKPRASGGRDTPVNWQATHRVCNLLKGHAKTYIGNCWLCKRAVSDEHNGESHYQRMHPNNRRFRPRPNGKRRRH